MSTPLFPRWSQIRPAHGSAMMALLCVGAALSYAALQETPRGRLAGQVTRSDTDAPLPFARITAYGPSGADYPEDTFYTRADAQGRFTFAGLPAGGYEVNAYSRREAYSSGGSVTTAVDESETTQLAVSLHRARPDLQLTQQQQVFAPGEKAVLPVHGYVDPSKPKNSDTLRLRVWKTRLSNVMSDSAAAAALQTVAYRWDAPKWLPAALLKPASAPKPQLIEDRPVKITEADVEGFYHKRMPLGTRGAGLYLAQMDHREGGRNVSVCAWVNVTDTSLITKRAGGQILAFITDLRSGAARPGVAVRFYQDGESVGVVHTNADGVANFTAPQADAKLMAVARRGDDEAVLSRDFYGEEENSGNIVTHVYTDRPIYRPGQKISFKGIMRDRFHADTDKPNSSPHYAIIQWIPKRKRVADIEIRDPSGVRILQTQKPINEFGSFAGEVELSPEAPTGLYSLMTTIDGEERTTDINVASYRKPEFEVAVTPGKPRYVAGEGMKLDIVAKYYFGAPVAGGKVSFEIYRSEDWSSEYNPYYEGEGYEGEGDEGEGEDYSGYGEFIRDGEGELDETGHLTVNFPARSAEEIKAMQEEGKPFDDPAAERPQIYTAHVTVTDAAERQVEGEGKARLVAGDFGLSVQPMGYLAKPGEPMNLNIVARDHDEKPVANVALDLETGYWRYEEPKPDANGNMSEYEAPQKSMFVAISTQRLTTDAQGVASASVTLPRGGDFTVTARAKDGGGRLIRDSTDLWAAGDTGGDDEYYYYGAQDELALFTDKKRYASGETARVLINSAKVGQSVLLTLEGERIYRSYVVPIKKRGTVARVPIEDEFGPNVYLAACYVKDKKFASSEIPLRVSVPSREVKVAVRADKADYPPGALVSYEVTTTDAKGKPVAAEFSFGVVDESIYALREDHPETLAKTFYPRRSNRVQTAHSFAAEYLGDADKGAMEIAPRKKFLDTAFWQPFEHTGADGRARVTFNLPDNLTKWRATAVAQTQNAAFGFTTQKITASKDFYVRLEKPRFLTQRDASRLLAFVHNDTGAPQNATVKIDMKGLSTTQEATQNLELAPGQVGEIAWPVTAESLDKATVTLAAWTNNRRFTDAVEETLTVRPHGRETVTARAGHVTGEGQMSSALLTLDPKAIRGVSRLTVRLTPSLMSALTGGLDYLIGYPYGCVEQTMSRFLPDILVSRVLRQSGANDDKSRKLLAELPKMVRDGLTRLYSMQHGSGGWGWWQYDADDDWMTAYVVYGLSEARRAGFAVDEGKFKAGRAAAVAMLPAAKGQHRAFLLYAIALASPTPQEKATMIYERNRTVWRGWDGEALAYLVMTDKLLGVKSVKARAAFERRVISGDDTFHWVSWGGDRNLYWNYDCNETTATAAALRALVTLDSKDPRVPGALRWLMARRTGEYWNSTRDTSFVLAALCEYLQAQPDAVVLTGSVSVRLNRAPLQTFALTPQAGHEPDLQVAVPGTQLRAGSNQITLKREGGGSPVFYSVQLRQTLSVEDIPPLAQTKFKLKREYLRVTTGDRARSWEISTEPTHNKLRQGDSVRVKLTFEAPREMAYVLIEDPFPSGCETSERGTADASVGEEWSYGYASLDVSAIDVRDDRIAFFARKVAAGTHTIEYHLRAQTPGVYHVLPAQVQAMYEPQLRAESAEDRVEVQ